MKAPQSSQKQQSALQAKSEANPTRGTDSSQSAGPYSAGQMLQLQKAVGNRAVMQLLSAQRQEKPVVQRKIDHDGKVFITTGTRPGWRKFLKQSTADELGVGVSSNFGKLGYDRAHRIPFAAIEELVCDFCNGDASGTEFAELTDSLYDAGDEYDTMVGAREDLETVVSDGDKPANIKLYANHLLGLLNSATKNVSPGDFSENRGIQDHVDYGYVASPGGTTFDLSPRSSDIHSAWDSWGREPGFPMSPGGENVRSSQISSEQQQNGTQVPFDKINF